MTVLNVTLVWSRILLVATTRKTWSRSSCLWPETKERSSRKIWANLSLKFKADIRARNTFFEQIYFFFKYCAKNRILAKYGSWHISEVDTWKCFFCYIWSQGTWGNGKNLRTHQNWRKSVIMRHPNDQGHLYTNLEVPRLTCPGRGSNPGLPRGKRAL